jgi:hypothetical protein
MITKKQLAGNYIKKFPSAGAKTVARVLYKENPQVFLSLEQAYSSVRYAIGSSGAKNRKACDKSVQRELRQPGNVFPALPPMWKDFPTWRAFNATEEGTTLVLQDIHIPFHDPEALTVALKAGQKNPPTVVLLNGDTLDFYGISTFVRDPRIRRFPKEIKTCIQFLEHLKGLFPKARIIFKTGNHEERYERYMCVKAPELLGIDSFDLQNVLELERLGIEYVSDKRPIMLGKLYALHGHEYRFPISNPVNPARGLFLRARVNSLCGHFHQTSQHSEKDLADKVTGCWSGGALCELHPPYMPLNKWNHGFMEVEVGRGGVFQVTNHKILHGKTY